MKSFRLYYACLALAVLVAGTALLGACASRTILVEVPPKMDLGRFKTIGIIEFDAGQDVGLGVQATRRFIESVQSAQPGTLILELGRMNSLLKTVGRTKLDAEAIKAIARKKGCDAVFTGNLTVSDVKTEVSLRSLSPRGVSAKAKVDGALRVKLYHTASGALAWSDSAKGEWTLARARLMHVHINDPDETYDDMINDLVYATTRDLRPTRERRPIKEEK